MRKYALILVILTALTLIVAFYPSYVEKPVKDGRGPLAVRLDPRYAAPETHNPLEWWQTHHWEVVNRGDLEQSNCLYCHDPQTSCNNCHNYVGAKEVIE